MRVLITGGHVTPALAVIDEIKDCEIVFVGRERALSSDTTHSFEYEEVKKRNVRFIDLPAGRFTRVLNLQSIKNIIKVPAGFVSAVAIIKQEKPDVVLSFGGYIALPIAVAAFVKKIPVITHEQTIRPGTANRLIGSIAKKIFVSFPQAVEFFPKEKVVVSGNPIRKEIHQVRNKIPQFKKKGPVLFISGGSLGSHDINQRIFSILPELVKKYTVIHQTGSTSEFRDFETAQQFSFKNYYPIRHIDSDLTGFVYSQTDLVVGRAGANTIFELLALKKPSLLIPLPWSAFGEQWKHARYMESLGVSQIYDQESAPEVLLSQINEMIGSLEKYTNNFNTITLPYESTQTAKQIAQEVIQVGH